MKKINLTVVLVGFAITALIVFGLVRDAQTTALTRLRIVQKEMRLDNCPPSLKDLRILYFSDVHLFGQQDNAYAARVFDAIQAQHPDVILFGGDLLDASSPVLTQDQSSFLQEQMAKLEAPLGLFAVLGEDDALRLDEIHALYAQYNIEILDNQSTLIHHYDQDAIRLVGLGLAPTGLDGLYPGDGLFTLSFAYDPQVVDQLTSTKTTWLLAGKTHGGQVTLPLIGSSYSKATGSHIHGQGMVNGIQLLISNGIGTSETQARFMDDPSLYVFTLK